PGDAQASLVVEAIRYESYEMPPKGKLAEHEIEVLVQWINSGAPWPDEAPPQPSTSSTPFDLDQRREAHWAWQPIASVAPAPVLHTQWPPSPIDHFILRD